jgi:excisionase family DNA binding protein
MPKIINSEEYYNAKEAMNYLGVSRQTLYNMEQDGRLVQYRQGIARTVYYRKEDLDRLLRMRREEEEQE